MSTHSQLAGLDLHDAFHFVQESDPGAVGSGKYWLKVSTAAIKRRNDDNTSWLPIGGTSPVTTTKGDLIVRNSSTDDRLPVGANGQILFADSTQTLGIKWGDAAAATLPQWILDLPDFPPVFPNSLDDEFESSSTLPGGGSAKWAWNMQNGASVTCTNGSLIFNSAQFATPQLIYQGISGNVTVTAKVVLNFAPLTYSEAGIHIDDSSTGRYFTLGIAIDNGNVIKIFGQRWTNSTFNSSVLNFAPISSSTFYLRIVRDSTNITAYYSFNGIIFNQIYQESKTAWLTGGQDRIGCHIRPNGGAGSGIFDWFRVF